jgi:hypothetical protein
MATSILSIYLRINEVDPNAKIQKILMKTTELLKQINNRVNSGFMRVGLVGYYALQSHALKARPQAGISFLGLRPIGLKFS